MKSPQFRFFFQLIIVICSVAICLYITPIIYGVMPSDYSRLILVADELKKSNDLDLIIFGNSKGMSGVDGNYIKEETDYYNLLSATSPGQSMAEMAIIMENMPENVKRVIQCFSYEQLYGRVDIDKEKVMLLKAHKYRPQGISETILPDYVTKKFKNTNFQDILLQRNSFKGGIHNILRKYLDTEVAGDSIKSLTYPYMYGSNHAPEITYNKYLTMAKDEKDIEKKNIPEETYDLLSQLDEYYTSKGIKWIIVEMPVSPDLQYKIPAWNDSVIMQLSEACPHAEVLDFTKILSKGDFYDPLHPNREGAKKITQRIIQNLE